MDPSNRQNLIPSAFNPAATRSRKLVNCENTSDLSFLSNTFKYLIISSILADLTGVTSSGSTYSDESGGSSRSEYGLMLCRQSGQELDRGRYSSIHEMQTGGQHRLLSRGLGRRVLQACPQSVILGLLSISKQIYHQLNRGNQVETYRTFLFIRNSLSQFSHQFLLLFLWHASSCYCRFIRYHSLWLQGSRISHFINETLGHKA